MGKLVALLLALGLVFGGMTHTMRPAQAQNGAAWTFLVYLDADNDLEPFALNDIMEMYVTADSPDVNVVVQMDRAEGFDDLFGSWTDTRRYLITGDEGGDDFSASPDGVLATLEQYEVPQDEYDRIASALDTATQAEIDEFAASSLLSAPVGGGFPAIIPPMDAEEEIGEVNMGDPATLVDFATWGISNFPAENYALVLWNHGATWFGVASDDQSNHDQLTMSEIDGALAEIISTTGIDKFDLIGFDACLMGQLEVMNVIAPYADYALASEELEPGAGWEYATPLSALVANPTMGAAELGTLFVDAYAKYYAEDLPSDGITLTTFDLAQVETVTAALANFSDVFMANSDALTPVLGDARNNAQAFTADTPDDADYYATIDLIDLMQLTQQFSGDETLNAAAQGVIDAAGQMIVHTYSSADRPGGNGVSIYYPTTEDNAYLGDNLSKYLPEIGDDFAFWQNFLAAYYGTAVAISDPSSLSVEIVGLTPEGSAVSIYDTPVISFLSSGQNILEMGYVVAYQFGDNTAIALDISQIISSEVGVDGEPLTEYPDGETLWDFYWNADMPVISDGLVEVPTALISESADSTTVSVSGLYISSDQDPFEAFLSFDTETQSVSNVWGIDTSGSPFQVPIVPGDQFQPTWRYFNENGEVELIPADAILTFSNTPFTYRYVPAYSGLYTMTIYLIDIAGNYSEQAIEIEVDNDGLDPAFQGFKDLDLGVAFLYPWEWYDPTTQYVDEEGGYQVIISDPLEEINIYIDPYLVESLDELTQVGLDRIAELENLEFSEPELIGVGEYEGTLTYYAFDWEGQPTVGAFVAVYVPENGLGYIIDFDATPEREEEAFAVFENLFNTLLFFPPLLSE